MKQDPVGTYLVNDQFLSIVLLTSRNRLKRQLDTLPAIAGAGKLPLFQHKSISTRSVVPLIANSQWPRAA
ncbi:hypothetical protein C1T17_11080 [Sphingobium sp. SCG-1]|nr:hypothetical protein C1T17_11080 [Sphingobium sp. SCG-1]